MLSEKYKIDGGGVVGVGVEVVVVDVVVVVGTGVVVGAGVVVGFT